ncbi:hypothetical protein [Pseudofrankia sp. DC12]|uniref:hypothetical protein n=1 Tax=Pseudofrankia sp. DC12 TaxID=683315 RepID=UPI0005F7AB96|nr:hypothetical protein [Pseudofrankia sp. DC12]
MSAPGRWANAGAGSDLEAAEYLTSADRLLRERLRGTESLWPRACVWLLRLALEAALRALWHRENASVATVSMRAQLLSLNSLDSLDPAVPARADHLWTVLSGACHYHPYELSPTVAELRSWHADVAALTQILASHGVS